MSYYRETKSEASDTHFKTALSAVIGQMMRQYGVSRTLESWLPYLLGAVTAVEIYQTYKKYWNYEDAFRVHDALNRTTLSVEVANNGRVSSSVDVGQVALRGGYDSLICYGRPVQNVTVKKKRGRTIYQIQNLNIYITADVVEQLNVNPKEVINYLHEEIQREIDRIGRWDE